MANPFVVGPPVRGRHLCGRDVELDRIASALGSGGVVAVSGAPGAGLTSLARELAHRLGRPEQPVLRLDMAEAEDGGEAAELLERALVVLPGGGEGEGPRGGERDAHLFLDGLRRDASVEAVRSFLGGRRIRRAGTLLLGSSPGVPELVDLAADTGPGRRPTEALALSPPPEAAWLPYVLERFLETDRWIGNHHVHRVLETTGGVPRPTQAVFHALWELTGEGGRVRDEAVDRAVRTAVEREGAAWRRILDGLTGNQRRVLRGLARQPEAGPFSGAFVAAQGLASPSSVQRALEALEARRLVRRDEDGGPPRPADPLLARWLRLRGDEAVDVTGGRG